MNYRLNQLFATLSNLTESFDTIAYTASSFLSYVLPKDNAAAWSPPSRPTIGPCGSSLCFKMCFNGMATLHCI